MVHHRQGIELRVGHALRCAACGLQRVDGHQRVAHALAQGLLGRGNEQVTQGQHPQEPPLREVIHDVDVIHEVGLRELCAQGGLCRPHRAVRREHRDVVGHQAAGGVGRVAQQRDQARARQRRHRLQASSEHVRRKGGGQVGGGIRSHQREDGALPLRSELLEHLLLAGGRQQLEHIGGQRCWQEQQQLGGMEVGQGLDQLGDVAGGEAHDAALVVTGGQRRAGLAAQKDELPPVAYTASVAASWPRGNKPSQRSSSAQGGSDERQAARVGLQRQVGGDTDLAPDEIEHQGITHVTREQHAVVAAVRCSTLADRRAADANLAPCPIDALDAAPRHQGLAAPGAPHNQVGDGRIALTRDVDRQIGQPAVG